MPANLALPLAIALGVAACGSTSDAPVPTKPASTAAHPAAQVAPATPVTVPEWIVVTGTIAARDRSDLVADVSGNVTSVLIERGSRVKKGDPLVRIDVRSAALGADEARANLASQEANRARVEAECSRSTRLYESGAITRSDWERDQATCTQAQQSVAAARARASLAGKSVADGVLRAPFDGVVSEKWVSPGEWASPGTRLVTLVSDGLRRADLQLSESNAAKVKLGATVELEPVALGGHVVPATITRIGAEIDPSSRALVAEASLPADPQILPGMFVRARIGVAERTLPSVPQSALLKRGSTWRVFAVAGNALEERVVQLGPKVADGRVAITRGLAAGDQVAIDATPATADGVALR